MTVIPLLLRVLSVTLAGLGVLAALLLNAGVDDEDTPRPTSTVTPAPAPDPAPVPPAALLPHTL